MGVSRGRAWVGRTLAPIARRCPLSPDAITILALTLSLAAAGVFALAARNPHLFLLAPLLAIAGGLLDAFDGVVARVKGLTSRWGDFLDHLADRVADGAMLMGWLVGSGVRPAIALPALLAVLLVGYAGTQIEATFGSRSYDDTGRAEFIAALVLLPLLSWGTVEYEVGPISGLSMPEWATLLLTVTALHALWQRVLRARRCARASAE